MQEVAPASEYFPVEHVTVQTAASVPPVPAPAFPAAQSVQVDAPAAAHFPLAQATQADANVDPVLALAVPVPQGVQVIAVAPPVEYDPAWQLP